ncbi:hypothetical protein HaLaN_08923, partial [Haematococcus lacustris]
LWKHRKSWCQLSCSTCSLTSWRRSKRR